MVGFFVLIWMILVVWCLLKLTNHFCKADKPTKNNLSKSDVDFIRSLKNEKDSTPDDVVC